ncbi:MAG: ATP-binding protein [Verrucomicrobiota bacterium]
MQPVTKMILQNSLGLSESEADCVLADPDALETKLSEQAPSQLADLLHSFDQFIDFQSREARAHIEALEQSRLESQKLQTTAEDASRLKDQFMANISHEIRTPMNGILGMMDLLRDTKLGEQQADYVDTIRRSGSSMMDVLDNILDFSRLAAGNMALQLKPAKVESLVRDSVDTFSAAAYEKNLELTFHIEPDVPRYVETDAIRVTQVLNNLIGNAIKFTSEGGIRVWVGMEPQESGRILFAVEDDGIGIHPSHVAVLFDPFVQADQGMSREFGGTGLGLTLCQSLVEMLGGSITVDSELGVGSNFTFTISARACMPNEELPISFPHPANSLAEDGSPFDELEPPSNSKRVLVVEDNPVNQKVAVFTIERLGHEVDLAENGVEAVEAVQNNSYDVVFMDLEMPVMGGIEATLEIRRNPQPNNPDLRIMAMTGHVFDAMRNRCAESGMDGFLPKPFKLADLKAALDG